MQVLLFIAIVLVLLSVFFAKSESMPLKYKIIMVLSIGIIIGLGFMYQSNVSEQTEHNRDIMNAFKQGKAIQCGDVEVSKKNFIYVSGTLSFVPNDKNMVHKGIVIDIVTCTVK